MALKFYTSVAKGLKLQVLGANFFNREVTREKLVGGGFSWIPKWGQVKSSYYLNTLPN